MTEATPYRKQNSQKVRQAFNKARSILIVCYGNIYRSPFAHYYARKILPEDITIDSGGYLKRPGRSCHDRAINIAAEFDVDMSHHKSRVLSAEQVKKADIILVFDSRNKASVIGEFPDSAGKIFYLGHLNDTGPVKISDPIEGNLYTVRNTYLHIKNALDYAVKFREKI